MFLTFSKKKLPPVFPKNVFSYLESFSKKRGGNIMTIGYQQARVAIIVISFFIGWCYMTKCHSESRILKVTLKNRANQLRNFTAPGRDYSIPVVSSIFYELRFYMSAFYRLDVNLKQRSTT